MIQLVNAQEMAKTYPDTFEAPAKEELADIKVGDSVKICINNKERLWVSITEIVGCQLKGTIDNSPITIDDVSFGDTILLKEENIYSVLN